MRRRRRRSKRETALRQETSIGHEYQFHNEKLVSRGSVKFLARSFALSNQHLPSISLEAQSIDPNYSSLRMTQFPFTLALFTEIEQPGDAPPWTPSSSIESANDPLRRILKPPHSRNRLIVQILQEWQKTISDEQSARSMFRCLRERCWCWRGGSVTAHLECIQDEP